MKRDASIDAQKLVTETAQKSTVGVSAEELISRVVQGLESGMRSKDSLLLDCIKSFNNERDKKRVTHFLYTLYIYGTPLSQAFSNEVVNAFIRVNHSSALISILEQPTVYGIFPDMEHFEKLLSHLLDLSSNSRTIFKVYHLALASFREPTSKLFDLTISGALQKDGDLDAALDTFNFAKTVGVNPSDSAVREIACAMLEQGRTESLLAFLKFASTPAQHVPTLKELSNIQTETFEIELSEADLKALKSSSKKRAPFIPKPALPLVVETNSSSSSSSSTSNETKNNEDKHEQHKKPVVQPEIQSLFDASGLKSIPPAILSKGQLRNNNVVFNSSSFEVFPSKSMFSNASPTSSTSSTTSSTWTKSPSAQLLVTAVESNQLPISKLKESLAAALTDQTQTTARLLKSISKHLLSSKKVTPTDLSSLLKTLSASNPRPELDELQAYVSEYKL